MPGWTQKGVLSVLFQVTSPAQSSPLLLRIVKRLLHFSAVSNVSIVPSVERVWNGGQSLRPVQAWVQSTARALFEVFIGAQGSWVSHSDIVCLHFPAIISLILKPEIHFKKLFGFFRPHTV